jgi:hypothetical protein
MTVRLPRDQTSQAPPDAGWSLSRVQFLTAAVVGLAAAGLPAASRAAAKPQPLSYSYPFFPQVMGTYTPEAVGDILNMLLTGEQWPVAILTAQLSEPVPADVSPLDLDVARAWLAKSVDHVLFLESQGAQSLSDTFATPGPLVYDRSVPRHKGKEVFTTIMTGAYMTAGREFAELGEPLLSKWMYQLGAAQAEERVLARTVLTIYGAPESTPPNNKGAETDLFIYVRDAYRLLDTMGFFGGYPNKVGYPPRDAVLAAAGPMAAAVVQAVPNNASVSSTIANIAAITNERASKP